MPPIRIVLCMIVKNEAAVIRRCLDAALGLVDGYVICDTGSSDSTPELVRQAAAELGVPGRVLAHPWRDFGHNRTLSASAARAWVEEQGWPLGHTYLLFLDADMVLRQGAPLDKQALTATSYLLCQRCPALSYYNLRLARLSHTWCAVGLTHEYWEAREQAPAPERLDDPWIDDVGDGGSKGDKLERDLRLLKAGLAAEPDNARYMFYLARTLEDAGLFEQAAYWYERRSQAGGWDEERWYAAYRRGVCQLELGASEQGSALLLAAFDERPSRAEPLHALARHYRERGQHHLALMLARQGLELAYPSDDLLFVWKEVYDWQLWEEVMISAYHGGEQRRELGATACERLRARRGHSPEFYEIVQGNSLYYVSELRAARRGSFTVSEALRTQGGTLYACTNPTLARIGERVFANVRLVNYRQHGGRVYEPLGDDAVIRTRNVTLEWDRWSARTLFEREADAALPPDFARATDVVGLEDQRWTTYAGAVWLTATCHQVPGNEGRAQVVLGRLNERLDALELLLPLHYEHARSVEKNWVPWSRPDGLFVIYSYDPCVVLRVDTTTGKTSAAAVRQPAFRAEGWRGSTTPIAIPSRAGRWLLLVHEVVRRRDDNVYLHRWLEIDAELRLVARSRPFVFEHVGVEYATGLCDIDSEVLLVSYGIEDAEARWAELEWRSVLAQLE
jgi:glycosyltransferase involved in cell wall biosynthesis